MVVRFAPTEAGQWDFHLISNAAELNDKTGTVNAADSDDPGFVVAANMHHWSYTEHQKPHLWMGAYRAALRLSRRRRVPLSGGCARGAEVQPPRADG